MYHQDNPYKTSSAKERLENRQQSVKPLVDAYFAWVKVQLSKSNGSTKLKVALTYSENQEMYLRVFLEEPEIPLDNNDAESAKANNLKPYEYFCYLLSELVKYPRNEVPEEELKKLMPWAKELPDSCRKTKTR